MSLTVPVLSKFETTSDVSAVSSGKSICYAQIDGKLIIDGAEKQLPPITSMFQTNFGDLIIGTRDGLHIFRDGEQIKFIEYLSGIESIHGKGDYCVVFRLFSKIY